jgi:hypothetical protein
VVVDVKVGPMVAVLLLPVEAVVSSRPFLGEKGKCHWTLNNDDENSR